jgi:hypothetical protein
MQFSKEICVIFDSLSKCVNACSKSLRKELPADTMQVMTE